MIHELEKIEIIYLQCYLLFKVSLKVSFPINFENVDNVKFLLIFK